MESTNHQTNGANSTASSPKPVSVSLQDLQHNNIPLPTLEQAFGPDSLGIILVTGLPPQFVALRKRLLSLSSYLANLPATELTKLENADANYAVGWSCGKETLADGRYDTLKGSYYAQPIHDAELEAKARRLYGGVKEFTSENVWPEENVLPGFEKVFEELCRLIVDVAAEVARACDRFGVERLAGYETGTLEGIVRGSVCTKARLLHYFPPPPAVSAQEARPDSAMAIDDDWCATHRDLGALTGLTSQMFVDESLHRPEPTSTGDYPDLPEMDAHPDPNAGLWIEDRAGRRTQVDIPRDALAFQTGEALELITRGAFKAVPHFVRGGKGGGKIARNTLAVFTQPNLWEMVDETRDFATLGQFNLREKNWTPWSRCLRSADDAPLFSFTKSLTKGKHIEAKKKYKWTFHFDFPRQAAKRKPGGYKGETKRSGLYNTDFHPLPPSVSYGEGHSDSAMVEYNLKADFSFEGEEEPRIAQPEFQLSFAPLPVVATDLTERMSICTEKEKYASSRLVGADMSFAQSVKDKMSSQTLSVGVLTQADVPAIIGAGETFPIRTKLVLNESTNARAVRYEGQSRHSPERETSVGEYMKLDATPEVRSADKDDEEDGDRKWWYYYAEFEAVIPDSFSPSFKTCTINHSYNLEMKLEADICGKAFEFKVDVPDVTIGASSA